MGRITNGGAARFSRLRTLRQRRRIIQLLLQGEATSQIALAFGREDTPLLGSRSRLSLTIIMPPPAAAPARDQDASPGHADA